MSPPTDALPLLADAALGAEPGVRPLSSGQLTVRLPTLNTIGPFVNAAGA